jgi:hypothetical protein
MLACAAASVLLVFRTPEPAGRDAAGFSAARAFEALPFIASEPRPFGSEAHERTRRWLLAEIRDLGPTPALQAVPVPAPETPEPGAEPEDEDETVLLTNVMARLPGTASTGAVLLVAHYDSREETPGAADDGAATVMLLQVLELLVRADPLRNDVIFLWTDAEEVGLVGARKFVEEHEWMQDVACVLNFDAIGNDGAVVMFQTGPGSGALIDLFGERAPRRVASSFAPAVYSVLPNDTDFTPFREAGLPGLNFAIVGGGSAYHAPSDLPRHLSEGTVQLMGDTALALTRALGAADLGTLERGERTYFDLGGELFVSFGPVATWIGIGAACLCLALAALALARRNGLRASALVQGVVTFGTYVLTSGILVFLIWYALDALGAALGERPDETAGSDRRSASIAMVGLALVAARVLSGALELTGSGEEVTTRRPAFLAGGLLAWLLALVGLALFAPSATAQFPLAAILCSLALIAERERPLLVPVLSAAALFLVAPSAALTYHVLSREPALAASVFSFLLAFGAGLFAPWLNAHRPGRWSGNLFLVVGLAALVTSAYARSRGI